MKHPIDEHAEIATGSKPLGRRRIIKLGAVAAATLMIPGVAAAGDWIRVDEVPLTSQVPGRMSIMRARTRAHYQQARYVPRRSYGGEVRSLKINNVHTGETLNTVYYENGDYVPGALNEVNYFFRDFRANLIKPIDPRLLDLLHTIHHSSDTTKPFNLVSGYRSPQTNAWLATQTEGVARHSMHIEGKAADINLPGRQLSLLQRIALAMRYGGVGYYPQAGFVHVDTGRVRRWG
ncbi:MAG: DUF882 domain-containing protein [Candidatus Binataceae bacterium]|nr:DUF882 domain-containing protein [Candidatus Binataceae bacterium]